jgi:hypothetical protein
MTMTPNGPKINREIEDSDKDLLVPGNINSTSQELQEFIHKLIKNDTFKFFP